MKYKPGQIVPASGIYRELNIANVWVTDVTCVKGEHFPPTEAMGYHYEIKHAAKHKPSKG